MPLSSPRSSSPDHAAAKPYVLLTGFDAFGADRQTQPALNPSWLAVQALHNKVIVKHRVIAAQLPTVFATASGTLLKLVERYQPALVICVGQAGGRSAVSIERVAINLCDASIADNAGDQPRDQPVVAHGPTAYFSTLPIHTMLCALENAGLPAELSCTAGTFVCNHVFYQLMHALASQPPGRSTLGGFIHVPYLPAQGTPSLSLADTVRALRVAVACALTSVTSG